MQVGGDRAAAAYRRATLPASSGDEVRTLRNSRNARLDALHSGLQDGPHTVATFVEAELRAERTIEIIRLGLPDIFFALDARAIKASHPRYPGHNQGRG